jgi:glycosyltransferase involved in cell wall biosynthesis
LVAPENPEQLAERMEYMLTHPEQCEVMGKDNRNKVVSQYSMAETARQYAQLYENIIAGNAMGSG